MTRKNIAMVLAGALSIGAMGNVRAGAQSDEKGAALSGGETLFVELDTSLDSKKAKADEQVAVRTTEALKIQGKVIFPKGTKIVGHVTQASARGKGDADSLLAIEFDKAVLKGGEEVSVRLAIKAVAPPQRNFPAGDSPGQDPMAGTHTGTMTSPMGTSRTSTTTPERGGGNAGSTENSAGPDSGLGNGGQLTAESHGVYGMSGVRLAADVSKATPISIVSSTGKNMRLDSGTRLLLVSITDVPANSKP